METSKGSSQAPSKITSYQQFMQQLSKSTSSKQSVKKTSSTLASQCQSKRSTNKCVTEITQSVTDRIPQKIIQTQSLFDGGPAFNSNLNVCRSPPSSYNQFMSIQTFQDSRHSESRDGLSANRKSCTRLKTVNNNNRQESTMSTWEYQEQNNPQQQHYKKNEGIASYLLNQIGLIVNDMPRLNKDRITYLDFLEILRELNMIQLNYEPSGNSDAVSKFWSILLSGGKQNVTCLVNLAIVVLAVMNIRSRPKSIKDFLFSVMGSSCTEVAGFNSAFNKKSHNDSTSTRVLTRSKQGFFDLSKEEVEHIYKSLKDLRVTRMFLGRISKKSVMIEEKSQRHSQYSFRPNISERSLELARNKRPKDHSISQEELYKREKERKEMEQCSFQPNTHRTTSTEKQTGKKRSEALYQLAKSKSKEKRDRKMDEIQLERSQEAFTFKPKILDVAPKTDRQKKLIEGQNKQLDRMLKARIQREVKNKAQSRGIPYNSKEIEKLRKQVAVQISVSSKTSRRYTAASEQHTMSVSHLQSQTDYNKENEINNYLLNSHKNAVATSDKAESKTRSNLSDSAVEDRPRKQIFTFEVYLTEDTCFDKITIYEGDNIEKVSRDFITKHNLKPEMQVKLIESLNYNLQRIRQETSDGEYLTRIDQESVQYSMEIDPRAANYF